MSRLIPACIILALMISSGPALAATQLVVTGIDEALEENVRLLVGAPPPAQERRNLRRYIAGLPEQTKAAMSALGYFNPSVRVTRNVQGENTVVTISVQANDPVLVNELTLTIEGDANDDPAFNRVLAELPLLEGSIFISDDYEASKAALIDQAQDLGYFEFAFSKNEVRVSRRRLTADVNLVAQSGPRYTFGDILFDQSVFTDTFLNRWVPFEPGAPYESGLIGELTQNLQNSGYFQSVRVLPLQDRRYGKTIPVKVDLTRKDNNQVGIGVGFATDTLFRTKFTWGRPLINRRGHSAEAGIGFSRDTQNASIAYRIPRRNEPLYNYWGIEYGLKNDQEGDTESFLSTLNFQRVSRTTSQWTESLFLRWERERFTAGGLEETTDLILPGVSYSRSRSRGSPFPVWGQAISFQLMGGSSRVLSTIDFLKTVGTFRYLRALSDRNTVIGAVQYGAIQSNDYPRVPVSQRFFAGGDRSVRGFSFKDLSPRDTDGEAIGGRYLEVLNLEYNYRFLDRWSGALFVDAGRAFNSFDTGYSVGAGFGVRWQSPVGPFRIDFATPISDNDGDGVRVHLSLGPDL
ncbi:MAG: autotransporter assembly complex family protein [Granulosicoccus sp.]